MLFNTPGFLFLFFPLCVLLVSLVKGRNKAAVLLLFSLTFYGIWSVKYLLLLLVSVIVNFYLGKKTYHCDSDRTRRYYKYLGVSLNLLLLGYFKYSNFVIENINTILHFEIPYADIILPLAISFYTFQQIAFICDCSKRSIDKPIFLEYLLFVTFFPQLIAGPIVHHKEVIPYFKKINVCYEQLTYGLCHFSIGIFKKVIIADKMAEYADPMFNIVAKGTNVSFFEAWIGAIAYTLQIYFDFSGYSDMAIGLAKVFNLNLPVNFNSPYKAINIVDFWRRWHITLSRFLRDYLYIPLGGNRKGVARRYVNLFLTMLLGGLWHGASWNFVIWGSLHGFYLVICHSLSYFSLKFNMYFSKLSTFIAVLIAWIFFRADSFSSSMNILSSMCGRNGFSLTSKFSFLIDKVDFIHLTNVSHVIHGKTQLVYIVIALIITVVAPNAQDIMRVVERRQMKLGIVHLAFFTFLLTFSILNMSKVNSFIYFQF
jgi:D-alanyl-lipoteichoic acid acyltransferase DltB (MBOAT superfamily)